MKKKLALALMCILIVVVSLAGCDSCTDDPGENENIANKVFESNVNVSINTPGTGFYPWIATGKDAEGKTIPDAQIDSLMSDNAPFYNWSTFSFEFKITTLRVTKISFEVVAEENCTLNLVLCKISGFDNFGIIKKPVLANSATLFDFNDLDLSKDKLNPLVLANMKSDEMTYGEYEAAGGYTTKWKITKLKVYGERI